MLGDLGKCYIECSTAIETGGADCRSILNEQVYNPIAHWIWAPQGWAFQLGVLDYAGGGPIEICSGVTGLVYSLYLGEISFVPDSVCPANENMRVGKRRGFGTERLAYKPHNISHIFIGTSFLWVGWLGRSHSVRLTINEPS